MASQSRKNSRHDGPWKRTPAQNALLRNKRAADRRKTEEDQRRKAVNYEPDAPVCSNCKHHTKERTILVDSLPRKQSARCALNKFKLKTLNGSCDKWEGVDGSTLLESK